MIDLWVDGYSVEQTAEKRGLSRSQILRISNNRKNAIEKLDAYLKQK